jgi:hypothetical protein
MQAQSPPSRLFQRVISQPYWRLGMPSLGSRRTTFFCATGVCCLGVSQRMTVGLGPC